MANVYATKNGSWSDITVWNTGALPTAADDVFSNNFTVNIDVSFTVLSLRSTASAPIVAGGSFNFNTAGVTGTVTNTTQSLFQGAANMINITATTGNVNLSVASNITGQNSTQYIINHTGLCNFIFNCLQLAALGATGGVFSKNTVGNTTINCTSLIGSSLGSSVALLVSNGPVTINASGSIIGGAGGNAILSTGTQVIINGDVIGGNGQASLVTTAPVNTITGNVTAGTVAAISSTTANIINVTGTVTASASAPAIASTNANGQVYLNGNMVNNNGKMAIFAPIVWLDKNNTTSAAFFTSGGVARTLYSADTVPNTPTVSNVRSGTIYGAGNSLIGTLVMPVAANVRNGVVYDNGTVGTALFTTSQFITELSSSTTPVAVRMQNLCTPMILGELMEAFKK